MISALRFGIFGWMLAIASVTLNAQSGDFRISPPDFKIVLNADARMHSAARIGERSLVVWGITVYDTISKTHRNELHTRVLAGTAINGPIVRVTDTAASPYGVAAVVPLADRFLVLWNDSRAGRPRIYMVRVDTLGMPLGEPDVLHEGRALKLEEWVWLHAEEHGYRLIWIEDSSGVMYRHARTLDSSGRPVDPVESLAMINFDWAMRYGTLGGASIIRFDTSTVKFMHADRREDQRSIPTGHLHIPRYIGADTSIALLEDVPGGMKRFTLYENLFNSAIARRVTFAPPAGAIPGVGAIGRDSAGRYTIVTISFLETGNRYVLRVIRRTLYENDSLGADEMLYDTWVSGLIAGGAYNSGARLDGFSYAAGDDNASANTITCYVDRRARGGSNYYESWTAVYNIYLDGEGHMFDPLVIPEEVERDDVRNHVATQWLYNDDSTMVGVPIGADTVVLVEPVAPTPIDLSQTHPILSLHGNTVLAGWRQESNSSLFGLASIVSGEGETTGIHRAFNADSWGGDRSGINRGSRRSDFLDLGGASLIDCRSLKEESSDGRAYGVWRQTTFVATPGGWRGIDTSTTVSGHYDEFVAGYDPNTGEVMTALDTWSGSGSMKRFAADGSLLWKRDSGFIMPDALIPLSGKRYLEIKGNSGREYDGDQFVRSWAIKGAAEPKSVRYLHLRGDRFIRCYPADGLDSAGMMVTTRFVIDLYESPKGFRSSVTFDAPWQRYEMSIAERPSDSALFITWGSDSGIHVTILDRDLNVRLRNILLNETGRSVRFPSSIFKGDTLHLAWEDYRNGDADIYGLVRWAPAGWTLHELGSEPGAPGRGSFEESRKASRLVNLFPVPTRDMVEADIEIDSATDLQVKVIDVAGRMVRPDEMHRVSEGRWRLRFSTIDLHPGTYFLVVEGAGGARSTARFIVAR